VRQVGERARVVHEGSDGGVRDGVRLRDHVGRRRPQPRLLDDDHVGTDRDPVRERVIDAALPRCLGAGLDAVAQPAVVLADDEHRGLSGIGLLTELELFEMALGRSVIADAPVRAGGHPAGEEVL
jgi:hypothetical protein